MKHLSKSLFYPLSFLLIISSVSAQAGYRYSPTQYPNISGQILFELKADRLDAEKDTGSPPNNAYINIEPDFSFNINRRWSVKTAWRLYPTNTVETRNPDYPERTRTFFSSERGLKQQDTTMIVEELKIDYQNDDLRAFAGKFNPRFGTAHLKSNRIGVFSTDITEDYQLRERIGVGVDAVLHNSRISLDTFFTDTTGLSGSINGRDDQSRDDGLSGNTGTFSSYTLSMEGERFFGIRNLSYNIGYRSLGVDTSRDNRAREVGYVAGAKYLIKTGYRTAVTPLFEVAKLDNFTGAKNRDATYTTLGLIGEYGNWKASLANITRNISHYDGAAKVSDRQFQVSASYKFSNHIVVDVSRSHMKEGGESGILYGAMVSYLYKF